MKYSEKLVDRHLVRVIKEAGGLTFKMHPLTDKGIPDRLVHLPGPRTFYVETKTTGEKCTPAQVEFHKMLRRVGIDVYVLDTKISDISELFTKSYKYGTN